MVYFKLLLNDKKLKTDNIYPVVVRVTYQRNNTTFNTGIRVAIEQWDANAYKIKPSHPNSQSLNKSITTYYSKIQNRSLQLMDEGNFSFDDLKERLNNDNMVAKLNKELSFNQFAAQLISEMYLTNKAGNAIIYQTATNRLMKYAAKPTLKFTEITYTFLEGYRQQLIKDKVKQNTISNYFRTIRAIYNKAIKAKLVDRAHYPFLASIFLSKPNAPRSGH